MPGEERFTPIDSEKMTHEVDDRVARPELAEPDDEKVEEIDSVPGMTPEELEKGSQS